MAPARMMQFVDQHVKNCRVCKTDLLLPDEIEQIRMFVLPDARMLKPSRTSGHDATPEISPDDDDDFETDDQYEDEDGQDIEEDEDDIEEDEDDIDVEDDLTDDDMI
ncbi:hypothetical protein [Desulfobulbus oligotrophicus]|uniref:Uncharacterized protein n=1 Tax=Desulfobulbus oligotrophicus TaxID=1909699 RepID=A0A7T5VC59_9BACT|nr:hypothetical protein [Desulfobulbus oligotrophicus]QQG65189.1 hypothetical protein HP555_04550 [Desulfobulbus oligotrophicus]